jgi:WD40 repeat protein
MTVFYGVALAFCFNLQWAAELALPEGNSAKVVSHTQWVRELWPDREGTWLISVGGNDKANLVRKWNLQDRKLVKIHDPLKRAWCFGVSDDNMKAAYCLTGEQNWAVVMASTSGDNLVNDLEVENDRVLDHPILFLPSVEKKLVCLFSTKTGAEIFIYDWEKGGRVVKHQTGFDDMSSMAKMMPGLFSLYMVSRDRRTVIAWDLKKAKVDGSYFKAPAGKEICLIKCFSSDKKICVGFDDGTIGFWYNGKNSDSTPIRISEAPIISCALSKDENHLYLGDGKGAVYCFDIKRSKTTEVFKAPMPISCLALLPKSNKIAIASGYLDRQDILGRITILDLITHEVEFIIENESVFDPPMQKVKKK